MRRAIIVLIAASLLAGFGCSSIRRVKNGGQPMTGCTHDLSTITELREIMKARGKSEPEAERPLEGLQIALTINGMVRGNAGQSDEEDYWCREENSVENFHNLIASLKANDIPSTVDFLAGQWIDPALQEEWLKAGNQLGSFTFKRQKAHSFSPAEFIEDLTRSEQILLPLIKKAGQRRKYFRYPRLKTSLDAGHRAAITEYLDKNGYVEVPATIDALDWKFSELFCKARSRGDQNCANLIKSYFNPLLFDSASRARALAKALTGRDVKHIMMFEATQFTCDNLDEILKFCKRMGVRFITLDEALADPFYQRRTPGGDSEAVDVLRRVQLRQAGEPDD